MKICLVHYSSAPGGIEVLLPGIIKLMPDYEFSVFVIRPLVPDAVNVYENSGLNIQRGSSNNFKAACKLWRFARANRSSVFHAFNTGPYFLMVIRFAGIRKVVYSVRGTIHYRSTTEKIIRRAIWRIGTSRRNRFIANSGYSRDVFTGYIPEAKPIIEVVYNPVDSSRLGYSGTSRNDGLLRIIYVGRLVEGKNLFRWLDIAKAIHAVRNNAVFCLYGEGPLREKLVEYCRTTGCESYVTFRGYVKEISEAYHEADLMIFISEFESFGNAVVECILCGTPVITSDIPSFREIFVNYPQFIVPGDHMTESVILKKIDELDLMRSLTEKAAMEFRSRFSTEQHITSLRRIYSSFDKSSIDKS